MPRRFNTTGPCDPVRHYMLPAEGRLPDLLELVEGEHYFVVHAPRQTGKTTAIRAFAARLRALGYAAVWASLESSQGAASVGGAEDRWIHALIDRAQGLEPPDRPPADTGAAPEGRSLFSFLRAWSARCARPLVLLLDEVDVVEGPALVSLLRQLRDGFVDRGVGAFPVSVVLVGMRDLRDYLTTAKDGRPVNPGSPFNIKKASITLRNFNLGEIADLLGQHTADTGQSFSPEAVALIAEQTRGQPFLVNALAEGCVRSTTGPVEVSTVWQAREALIAARTTHLDALSERLKDTRVARVLEGVLLGDRALPVDTDDFVYTIDLGLVQDTPDGAQIANPMYREILTRVLSNKRQSAIPRPWWPWRRPDGGLDMGALVEAFLGWWTENEAMVKEEDAGAYPEAVAHLSFMAFLQRVVNGGGRVYREFAAGRGAVDLLVEYGGERFVVELKRVRPRHDSLERARERGAAQLSGYLQSLGLTEGWLIVFDQRDLPPAARQWREDRPVDGLLLHLRGC
jgi:hypothetical protein